jgi:thymidine kinase
MKQEFVIYTGPMFGGKTSRMLSQLERAKYQKKVIKLFKPKIDTRYSTESVTSHNGNKWVSVNIDNGKEILEHLGKAQVVAVDEAFMIPDVANVLINLFKEGKSVYVSSLQLSSKGLVFDEMSKMLPWATKIEICPAVCFCGEDAFYTIPLTENKEPVGVGGKENYEPRCKEHTHFMAS